LGRAHPAYSISPSPNLVPFPPHLAYSLSPSSGQPEANPAYQEPPMVALERQGC